MNYAKAIEQVEAIQKDLEAERAHLHHGDAITRCITLKRSLSQAAAVETEKAAVTNQVDAQLAEAAAAQNSKPKTRN